MSFRNRDAFLMIPGLASRVFLSLVLLVSTSSFAALPATIARIKPGIVGVGSYQLTRTPAALLSGSGFVVGNGHYVITNLHVVNRPLDYPRKEYLAVFVGRGSRSGVRRAGKIAIDPRHDLALLKIWGEPLKPLRLGASEKVKEGELYAFTGFPIGAVLGLYPVTHRGIISAITPIVTPMDRSDQLSARLIKRLRSPYNVFQLDATAYPGNSGSPLYDPETGKVIAVVNMVFVKGTKESVLKDPSGITYAMPARYVRALMRSAGIAEP